MESDGAYPGRVWMPIDQAMIAISPQSVQSPQLPSSIPSTFDYQGTP
jgi:hypothetical protein